MQKNKHIFCLFVVILLPLVVQARIGVLDSHLEKGQRAPIRKGEKIMNCPAEALAGVYLF